MTSHPFHVPSLQQYLHVLSITTHNDIYCIEDFNVGRELSSESLVRSMQRSLQRRIFQRFSQWVVIELTPPSGGFGIAFVQNRFHLNPFVCG